MKTKNFVGVLVLVLILAAFAVTPVLALDGAPPVEPPVFDWAQISQALEVLLTAILLPIASFAARWVYAKGSYEKSQLSTEQQYLVSAAFRTFVFAAEQLKAKEFIVDKLDYATSMAEAYLVEHGIKMDLEMIRAQIEAIVYKEFRTAEYEALD